ncbi:MAG: 5-formyltetrahydrofolate cyclo-ligase [Candidatus Liberibacter ctenarytainae]|uniref:5-formyltetrahydrofolate cyclo-ligase n=1 Tax=Candidatus Liberibacter ctenarytainae TaxID=2020335 RepID=A0A937ALG3_9HYPH|nr:5-formyltetrahydrofolate cyclo-ligase [Candidatus Liberibacter ctenarytainae]
MTPKEHKHLLRKKKIVLRNLLSPEYRLMKSTSLAIRGEKDIPFKMGMKIATFYPILSEVNVNLLVERIKKNGYVFCLPVIVNGKMVFRQYNHQEILVKAQFGTLSPPPSSPEIDPDLILMPLIAFDSNGNRIGYGKGHYDRAIADARLKRKDPYLVGIAFDIQETSNIKVEPTDIRLHAVLTENRFNQFNQSVAKI